VIARRWHALPARSDVSGWRTAFAVGLGLTGAGWGAAGILLYPAAHLPNQVFLVFVLGGMMLGASLLLAPRPEAFLAFLIPTGLGPAIRLFLEGDKTHAAMGLLAVVFTLAILTTTGRIYRMVETSLRLQIENQDLVEDLRSANHATAALNQALELRVQERTAELYQSAQQLRAEIAHREQAEEELLRARKLESLGVLAGGIAHDFNNFLTVVQGNIEVAKAQLNQQEAAQEFLDQAASACQRAKFLSSQLLTFAKGGAPVQRVVSIAELVTDAVQLARTGSPVAIEVTIAEDLWSAKVDPGQIGQVLMNLAVNSRDAMPQGGKLTIETSNVQLDETYTAHHAHCKPGRYVKLAISDNGCGMTPDIRAHIFEPYFTTKGLGKGAGLGLATVYGIIKQSGGNVDIYTEPGLGTTFKIYFPIVEEPLQPLPLGQSAAPVKDGTETVLLVEDESAVRAIALLALQARGYTVVQAESGDRAAEIIDKRQGHIDLLVTDVVMPGTSGRRLAEALQVRFPDLKVLYVSGYTDDSVIRHGILRAEVAFLQKPYTPLALARKVREVLDER
jgi:signal transduction histidine kinase